MLTKVPSVSKHDPAVIKKFMNSLSVHNTDMAVKDDKVLMQHKVAQGALTRPLVEWF